MCVCVLPAEYAGPESLLPIRIELKQFCARSDAAAKKLGVADLVAATLRKVCGNALLGSADSDAQIAVLRASQRTVTVLVLDGYDEISETGGVAVQLLRELERELAQWARVRVVVSCRTQFLGGSTDWARFFGSARSPVAAGPFFVAPFTPAQIEQYLRERLGSDEELRDEIGAALGAAATQGQSLADACIAAFAVCRGWSSWCAVRCCWCWRPGRCRCCWGGALPVGG